MEGRRAEREKKKQDENGREREKKKLKSPVLDGKALHVFLYGREGEKKKGTTKKGHQKGGLGNFSTTKKKKSDKGQMTGELLLFYGSWKEKKTPRRCLAVCYKGRKKERKPRQGEAETLTHPRAPRGEARWARL